VEMVDEERPALILIDFEISDIDGKTMMLMLKKQLGGSNAPPIVAMTSHNTAFEIHFAQRVGCVACLSKPFLPIALIEVVHRVSKVFSFDTLPVRPRR